MDQSQDAKKTIMIVEDDTFMAGLLERKFKQADFQIVTALSADQARDLMKENPVKLILLDVILPGTDGITFLKELKANPATKEIPVIITSNLGSPEEIERGLKEGAADYIVKAHATPVEIVEKVKTIVK